MICLIAAFAHAKHDHFLHATEAKAKDTKKIQGQRQPFWRTDPLETKDRNARGQGEGEGHSSKKFFRQFPIHRHSQNF